MRLAVQGIKDIALLTDGVVGRLRERGVRIDGLHQAVIPVILILRGKRFRRAIRLGARYGLSQLVAIGVIREGTDVAEPVRLMSDVTVAVINEAGSVPESVLYSKGQSLRVVGISGDLAQRILAGEQVPIGVISVRCNVTLRVRHGQELSPAVVGIAGHVAERISFA